MLPIVKIRLATHEVSLERRKEMEPVTLVGKVSSFTGTLSPMVLSLLLAKLPSTVALIVFGVIVPISILSRVILPSKVPVKVTRVFPVVEQVIL